MISLGRAGDLVTRRGQVASFYFCLSSMTLDIHAQRVRNHVKSRAQLSICESTVLVQIRQLNQTTHKQCSDGTLALMHGEEPNSLCRLSNDDYIRARSNLKLIVPDRGLSISRSKIRLLPILLRRWGSR